MSLINLRLPVADKEVFWDTLETNDGWKFQHNKVVGQYRVVSPGKYREAWGFEHDKILKDFKRLSKFTENETVVVTQSVSNNVHSSLKSSPSKLELLTELDKVSELFQKGILMEEEFQQERKKIMDKLNKLL